MGWREDSDYRAVTITRVESAEIGWSITGDDGWSFFVDAAGGVIPRVGQVARFYGKGIGFEVRGLVLDDTPVFYRTAEEDEERHREWSYPKDARTALARWDSGDTIFTVELGGLGPGYEQCIHITVFELIRAIKDRPDVIYSSDNKWVRDELDKAMFASPIIDRLSLSGAQAGVAQNLAFAALRDGWRATMEKYPEDRRIQVSRHFPSAEP